MVVVVTAQRSWVDVKGGQEGFVGSWEGLYGRWEGLKGHKASEVAGSASEAAAGPFKGQRIQLV